MFTRVHSCSLVVTRGHPWSLVVTRGHSWLFVVTRGHSWSLVSTFSPYRHGHGLLHTHDTDAMLDLQSEPRGLM